MGTAELDAFRKTITIYSNINTYGKAANEQLTGLIREEIETLWNEPNTSVRLHEADFSVVFSISAAFHPGISIEEIISNVDSRNNYFRIEEYAHGNISFVDGLGCNTGYFKLENLYKGSTTAAHEYGHTLGLDHPLDLDHRGRGVPGIMFPRGTLVDPEYQYDPAKPAGVTGGTMHPMYRKVFASDIHAINLQRLRFTNNIAIVGEFTNVYHHDHADQHWV